MRLTRSFRVPMRNDLYPLFVKSKELYNQTNYIVRNNTKRGGMYFNYRVTDKIAKSLHNLEGEINYRYLPAQTSQQILKLLDKDWKSFFEAIKVWKKHPELFKKKPEPPKYKKEVNLLLFTSQQVKIDLINRKIKLPNGLGEFYIPKDVFTMKLENLKMVRLIPKHKTIQVDIVYEVDELNPRLLKNRWASLDIGLNNLVTMVSNRTNALIFNGKPLKSINQYYNKKMAKIQSEKERNKINKKIYTNKQHILKQKREDLIKDYLHKTSKEVVKQLWDNKISTLIIGKNKEWKQEINLGKETNQKFTMIPFEKLLSMIEYRCKMIGIKVVYQEESYTSKADALAFDELPIYDEKNKKASYFFSGKRVKRGLYQSSVGVLINADVNGALNIARKYFGILEKRFKLPNRGLLLNPVRITPNKDFQLGGLNEFR